jgi:hypothetical protein
MNKIKKSIMLGCLALLPTCVLAQENKDFYEAFSGEWIVFDPAFSAGASPCSIVLETSGQAEASQPEAQKRLNAATENCAPPIATVVGWGIDENQLALFSETGQVAARLGGNPTRITGDLQSSTDSIVLDRANGGQFQIDFAKALSRHNCIYLGYSSECASTEQLQVPKFDADDSENAQVKVLVELNVREQPRRDATVLGKVPAASCLTLNFCSVTGDGIWCRATFGETEGWLSKSAVRQSEWPVTTFVNGCDDAQ